MRSDLPWNVAGIPSEAREAARAAARREGLSVGEWLTRRILRSFADAGDEDELTRDSYARTYRPEEPASPSSSARDTDEMLERVSRSASETSDVYRRIEEQLKGVARRMEHQERNQTENNRAMSKAATEMNIAAREQAQAFDQMGAHVVGLADRLERVERAGTQNTMKDAVKGLHTGLSRLADQITENASQSATQIGALADSLEAMAGRIGQARADTESIVRNLEGRFAALDDRIYAVEKASHGASSALERALEQLHARIQEDQEAREAATAGTIARIEENVSRQDARGTDPEVEKRLSGIERNLGDLIEKIEGNEPTTARAIEDSLKKLLNRVEATENRQRDTVSEFRAALNDTASRLAAIEVKAAAPVFAQQPVAAPAPFAPPPQAFDAPPFPDVPTPGAPPPFQAAQHDPFAPAAADPFAPSPQQAFDAPPPFADDPFAPPPVTGDAFAGASPAGDSFISAARRSARAAATAAEAEQTSRGFAWGSGAKAEPSAEGSGGNTRIVLIALAALVAIALVAGIVLSQGAASHSSGLGALFAPKQAAPVASSDAGTPLHAVAPNDDTVNAAPPAPQAARSAAVRPLQQRQVAPAPVHAVPTAPQQSASVPALDRLTALATGGNPKAETIVGLKYLNGEGVAVNEAQAAKWLERAAEAGEPVAQYRLGYLYELGKGVPADPAKATHWYQASAMQGNRKAMHNLAIAYSEGTGIKKDPSESARWFSKAASLGLTDSQFNLAVLYERGQGVPQSLLDAYKWYAIAAAGGDGESKSRIDALSTQLSADDRSAAQHAADSFRAGALDPHANVPPTQGDLPQG
jgi:localization factor PodJL